MKSIHTYKIADLPLSISFIGRGENSKALIPSFEPFTWNEDVKGEDLFFHLEVDDAICQVPETERTRIREVDTCNGWTVVDLCSDGGYQFIIKDIERNSCCLLITDKDFRHCRCALRGSSSMRSFGLNNALMLIFAFAGSRYDLVLIHASVVRNGGYGYAFIAKSGTGKSTQVGMWLNHIPECDMMNDDNPVIRIIDGHPTIYGSPWSGKTPCYRNVKAPLGALTQIVRDTVNFVKPLTTLESFSYIIASVSTMKWDSDIFGRICNIISKLIETTPIYALHCLPNEEAAIVCHKAISRA